MDPSIFILATTILIPPFTAHLAIELARADHARVLGPRAPIVLGVGLLAGAANGYLPPLSTLREAVFVAQPLMILGMALFLGLSAGSTARGQAFFAGAPIRPFARVGVWRAVFGGLLIAAGVSGGLPTGFFWSAGLGDIAVGLWALSMTLRGGEPSRVEFAAWNIAGLADLLHVLAVGVANLPGFYAAHPDIERLGLLPLFGVPLFIAGHVTLLRTLARARHTVVPA